MNKLLVRISVLLLAALAVVVLASWLLAATAAPWPVHSLLSAEGIRSFLGGFVDALRQPPLVWLLLLAAAWGCARASGLSDLRLSSWRQQRQRLFVLAAILVAFVGVVVLLTAVPHAVLLSATGRLWPSPFSRALVPLASLCVVLLSVACGVMSRRFLSVGAVFQALADGIAVWSPLFLLYVLAAQLVASLRFAFPFLF